MNEPATVDAPSTPEPTAPPVADAPQSIAEHEAQLTAARDPEAPPSQTRHRARGQFAKADDVPVIASLTKELRALESELGITQQDGESPRVYALRRQLEIAKQAKASKAAPAPKAEAVAAPAPVRIPPASPQPAVASAAVPDKFTFQPYDQYLQAHPEADYDAWQDAKLDAHADWREAKREQTARQAEAKAAQDAEAHAYDTRMKADMATYANRVTEFMKTQPDFQALIKPVFDQYPISDLALAALIRDDNGPQAVLYLARHPEVLDEIQLLSDGKAVTDTTVAQVQRLLKTRMQAVGTGSAAAPSLASPSVPRPPNPVRTGPQAPGETVPGDGHSLADHERAWAPAKRRR